MKKIIAIILATITIESQAGISNNYKKGYNTGYNRGYDNGYRDHRESVKHDIAVVVFSGIAIFVGYNILQDLRLKKKF